jgi:hypothetical protein
MQHRTIEEILETPIDEATAEDLARLRVFYEDGLGEKRLETTHPFAQLLGPDERLGDVGVGSLIQVARGSAREAEIPAAARVGEAVERTGSTVADQAG